MKNVKDILLNEQNDLVIKDGDFDVQHSDGQHVKLILLSEPGAWRQSALVGVGLRKMLNMKMSRGDRMVLEKQITQQLQYDGYEVKSVGISNKKNLSIDYERI